MSRIRTASLLAAGMAAGVCCFAGQASAQDVPPHARPGQCFAKIARPPVYGVTRRKVLVSAGWSETRRTPDVTARVARRVLVQSGRVERIRTAPVWRKETTWVTHPGARHTVTEPARYETVQDKVLVEAGHAEWRRQSAPLSYGETSSGQTMVQATGEIVCRVWVPARYEYASRRVMVSPGRSYEVEGPPRREAVTRNVQVSAGASYEKRIAPVYRTEYVTQVVRRGGVRVIRHAPTYRTVSTRRIVRGGGYTWAPIVCIPHG